MIFIEYKPNHCHTFANVCLVENTDPELLEEEDADQRNLRVMVWNNPHDEDYETGPIIINHKEIDEINL